MVIRPSTGASTPLAQHAGGEAREDRAEAERDREPDRPCPKQHRGHGRDREARERRP
jgi:hypothetical protein